MPSARSRPAIWSCSANAYPITGILRVHRAGFRSSGTSPRAIPCGLSQRISSSAISSSGPNAACTCVGGPRRPSPRSCRMLPGVRAPDSSRRCCVSWRRWPTRRSRISRCSHRAVSRSAPSPIIRRPFRSPSNISWPTSATRSGWRTSSRSPASAGRPSPGSLSNTPVTASARS